MRFADLPPIVTPDQMRNIDNRTMRQHGVPSLTLMENAGAGIARVIIDDIFSGEITGRHVAVVCGTGNNGGDGFVIARHLAAAGFSVTVYLLGSLSDLKGDALANAERWGARPISLSGHDAVPDFGSFDLLVDAIYGTGFHGEIGGVTARTIAAMNASGVEIVAVDLPSGLDGASGAVAGSAVHADRTFALAASKRGQWMWPGRASVGVIDIIGIGITEQAILAEEINLRLITEEFVRSTLPSRPPDAQKGTFGKALILGGSAGMSGSIVLAANACMRSGVGLTYAGVPESIVDVVDAGSIETVVRSLPEVRTRRVLAKRALGEIVKLSESVDAVAIGPGLSTHHETQELVRRLIERHVKPTVLDADGLNACSKDRAVLESERDTPLIITPHAGEMARLLNCSVTDVNADREQTARQAAERFGCVVVMKGAPTFVAGIDGVVYLNPTGNSGMATAGVGDVLTGVILSLLAQGCAPLDAAICGVYIHGLAGDLAAEENGGRGMVASDLVAALPSAFLQF